VENKNNNKLQHQPPTPIAHNNHQQQPPAATIASIDNQRQRPSATMTTNTKHQWKCPLAPTYQPPIYIYSSGKM